MKGLEPKLEPKLELALAQDRRCREQRGREVVRTGMRLSLDPWGNGRQKDRERRIEFAGSRYLQVDQFGVNPLDGCLGSRRRICRDQVASMSTERAPKQ